MARLRDELDGWRQALSQREILLRLLSVALCATLLVGVGTVATRYTDAWVVLLVSFSVVLGALLVRLRLTGKV